MRVGLFGITSISILLFGCASDSVPESMPESAEKVYVGVDSVPSLQQKGRYNSAAAILASFLAYSRTPGIAADSESERRLAVELGTRGDEARQSGGFPGTSPYEVKQLLEKYKFAVQLDFSSANDGSQMAKLKANLKNRVPTLVKTAEHFGKWYLAVGYREGQLPDKSDEVLVLLDPADRFDGLPDGIRLIAPEQFDGIWFDPSNPSGILHRPMITATAPGQSWEL